MKKKLFFAALAALAMVGCTGPQDTGNGAPTIFQGKFINYNGEYVEFFLPVDGDYLEIPIAVAQDGTFCDTVQFAKNEYDLALFADKFMFRICLEQGKTYNAEFDLTDEGVETNFRFMGEGEKENAFLSHLWRDFSYTSEVVKGLPECNSFKAFMGEVNKIADGLRAELKGVGNKPFIKYYEDVLDSSIRGFVSYYPYLSVSQNGTYNPDPDYLAAIKPFKKLSDEEFAAVIQGLAYTAYEGPVDMKEMLLAAADMTDDPARKASALETMLTTFIGAGNVQNLTGALEYYKEQVAEPDQDILKDCENASLLGPGSSAPDIEFEDLTGNVFHLGDFLGKPLYVDLWASWCGPCCAEIPHLAKMVEALGSDPEIVCISVSTDEDRDEWVKKLAEEGESTWPQFLATQKGNIAISRDYNVMAIPRFLLFNADGTIASTNAPRPSSANVIDALKALL